MPPIDHESLLLITARISQFGKYGRSGVKTMCPRQRSREEGDALTV